MGLVEMKCGHCQTIFYGVVGRDVYCHICKIIILFRKAFELEDIEVEEIDFNRVRVPQFKELYIDEKDWRNFIPEGLKKMWSQLPMEAAVLATMFAEREARAINIISDKVAEIIKEEEL